ncbi:MAG: AAA family ATPase [Proteobacteria bacterium]|nr:AAA family ATPase [Pseudomonadota bacterium]
MQQPDLNFAIMGIRRIGKTSLLREIRRRLLDQKENPDRIVWMDCSTISSPPHFVQEIVRTLHARELPRLKQPEKYLFFLPNFLKRMSKMHGGRITILLDEADSILTWARDVQGVLPALRASVTAGHCRYVVTGFQNLLSEFYDQYSPLYMAFESLRLGPFEEEDTEDVILRPMRALRVKFKNARDLVSRVHADTRGHPLLVQFYCRKLIEQLEHREDRTLGPDSLGDIYTGDDFRSLIVNTFRDNVSTQGKVLVYALLNYFSEDRETFTQDEMYRALLRKGCSFQPEEIDRVCERLVLAGIFVHKGPRHQFAHPIFPRILRANYNLEHLLSVAKKEIER